MILLILGFYLVAIILLFISHCLTNYSCGKIVKRLSYTIINSVCFSLLMFVIPNIVTAIAIEIKEGTFGDFTYPFSTVLMATSLIMILASNFVFIWKS